MERRPTLVKARPGNPTLWCLHPPGCCTTPESAVPRLPLGGSFVQRNATEHTVGVGPPTTSQTEVRDPRLEQRLRALGAVLLEIAGNRRAPAVAQNMPAAGDEEAPEAEPMTSYTDEP